jgi:hypothetical protein
MAAANGHLDIVGLLVDAGAVRRETVLRQLYTTHACMRV